MANGGEIKEAQGEGTSPDISLAKKLAIENATRKLSNNNEFKVTNTIILDEKVFIEGGKYKYIVKIKATLVPK